MMESQSQINDGGPAFPRTGSKTIDGYGVDEQDGMSLRDYFAAKAMQALAGAVAASGAVDEVKNIAAGAYELADSMLKARSAS